MNRKILVAGIVIIFIILIFLLIFNFKQVVNSKVIDNGNVREITVDAKQFEFNPNIIKVKEGEKIRIKINNLDVEHAISIPELGIDIHDEGEFVAEKKGNFSFSCHVYCGSGHENMKGVLVVE